MLVNYTGIIINTGKKKEKTQSKIVNYTPQGYGKIYILLPKVYKKLYTGIIDWFLGSFTNFMIRQVSRLPREVKTTK